MTYHHMAYQCSSLTPRLEASHVSNLPIDVLNEDLSQTVQLVHHTWMLCALQNVQDLCKWLCLQDKPLFIVRRLDAWYAEHYRVLVMVQSSDKRRKLLAHYDLTDPYPLAQYTAGGRRMVALMRYTHVWGGVVTVPTFQHSVPIPVKIPGSLYQLQYQSKTWIITINNIN